MPEYGTVAYEATIEVQEPVTSLESTPSMDRRSVFHANLYEQSAVYHTYRIQFEADDDDMAMDDAVAMAREFGGQYVKFDTVKIDPVKITITLRSGIVSASGRIDHPNNFIGGRIIKHPEHLKLFDLQR